MALSDEELRTIAEMEIDLAEDNLVVPPHEQRSRTRNLLPDFGAFEWTVTALLGGALIAIGLGDDTTTGVVLAAVGYLLLVSGLVPLLRWTKRRVAARLRNSP